MNKTAGGIKRGQKRRKLRNIVKGFQGRRNRCYSLMLRAAQKSKADSYIGRKEKKRYFKRLWNKVISIWAQNNGKNYSQVIGNLIQKYGNRKSIYQAIRKRGQLGDHLASNL